ncbi:WXG100 family type VII secretion target [Saccharopolyspora pogona]|uniref:WXG100 family type VII secretion target n=1 Tax=Saccharopolyspora pogona TaxID=333966 RepID=UPI001682EF30
MIVATLKSDRSRVKSSVEVDLQQPRQVRARARGPRAFPGRCPRGTHLRQMLFVDPVQHPPGGRLFGNLIDNGLDAGVHGESEGEPYPTIPARLGEGMGCAGGVRAGHHPHSVGISRLRPRIPGQGGQCLIPGEPSSIEDTVTKLGQQSEKFGTVGDDLKRVDIVGWTGEASTAFMDLFSKEPPKWLKVCDLLDAASTSLTEYASTLRWAQGRAAESHRPMGKGLSRNGEGHSRVTRPSRKPMHRTRPMPLLGVPTLFLSRHFRILVSGLGRKQSSCSPALANS